MRNIKIVLTEEARKNRIQFVQNTLSMLAGRQELPEGLTQPRGFAYNPITNKAFSPSDQLKIMLQDKGPADPSANPRYITKEEARLNGADILPGANPIKIEKTSLMRDKVTGELSLLISSRTIYNVDQTTYIDKNPPLQYTEKEKVALMENFISQVKKSQENLDKSIIHELSASIREHAKDRKLGDFDINEETYRKILRGGVVNYAVKNKLYNDLENRSLQDFDKIENSQDLNRATRQYLTARISIEMAEKGEINISPSELETLKENRNRILAESMEQQKEFGMEHSTIEADMKYRKDTVLKYEEYARKDIDDLYNHDGIEQQKYERKTIIRQDRSSFRSDMMGLMLAHEMGVITDEHPFQTREKNLEGQYRSYTKYPDLLNEYRKNPDMLLSDIQKAGEIVENFKKDEFFKERVRGKKIERSREIRRINILTKEHTPNPNYEYKLETREEWDKRQDLKLYAERALNEPTLRHDIEYAQMERKEQISREIESIHKIDDYHMDVPTSLIKKIARARKSQGLPSKPQDFVRISQNADVPVNLNTDKRVVLLYDNNGLLPCRSKTELVNQYMNGKEGTNIVKTLYQKEAEIGKKLAIQNYIQKKKQKSLIKSRQRAIEKGLLKTKDRERKIERTRSKGIER